MFSVLSALWWWDALCFTCINAGSSVSVLGTQETSIEMAIFYLGPESLGFPPHPFSKSMINLEIYHQKKRTIQPATFIIMSNLGSHDSYVNTTQLPSIFNLNLQFAKAHSCLKGFLAERQTQEEPLARCNKHTCSEFHLFLDCSLAPANDFHDFQSVQNSITRDTGSKTTILYIIKSFIFTDVLHFFIHLSLFVKFLKWCALLSKTKPRKASPCLHAMWWSDKYSKVPPAPSAQSVSWTSQPPIPGTEQQV